MADPTLYNHIAMIVFKGRAEKSVSVGERRQKASAE